MPTIDPLRRRRPWWLKRRLRARLGRSAQPTTGAERCLDLLVVSDLHLGESVKDRTRIEYLKTEGGADKEFCHFLEHFRTNRPHGRPWCLVLAGDVFDLLASRLSPDPDTALQRYGFTVTSQERRRGLDNTGSKIRWKLGRVLDRHPGFLAYLADFIGSGNRVVFLAGNHDAELYWPLAQQELVERLVDVYFGSEEVSGTTPEQFRSRIEFRSWIFHVPGLLHIQHGHQFDPYCSLQRPLDPRRPDREELMELSATAILLRYGLSRVSGVRSHGKDAFRFRDYLQWVRGLPRAQRRGLAGAYFRSVHEQMRYWRSIRRADVGRAEEQHLLALAREANRLDIPFPTLLELSTFQARPAHHGYGSIISSMFIDTLLTLLALPVTLLVWLLCSPFRWRGRLLGVGGILLGAGLLLRRFDRRRDSEVAPKLRDAARRLAPLVGTPFVVMGHSHKAELLKVGPSSYFVNTGGWIRPDEAAPPHGERCDCPLTFLQVQTIEERGEAEAALMRWCPQERRPVPLTVQLVPLPAEQPAAASAPTPTLLAVPPARSRRAARKTRLRSPKTASRPGGAAADGKSGREES